MRERGRERLNPEQEPGEGKWQVRGGGGEEGGVRRPMDGERWGSSWCGEVHAERQVYSKH